MGCSAPDGWIGSQQPVLTAPSYELKTKLLLSSQRIKQLSSETLTSSISSVQSSRKKAAKSRRTRRRGTKMASLFRSVLHLHVCFFSSFLPVLASSLPLSLRGSDFAEGGDEGNIVILLPLLVRPQSGTEAAELQRVGAAQPPERNPGPSVGLSVVHTKLCLIQLWFCAASDAHCDVPHKGLGNRRLHEKVPEGHDRPGRVWDQATRSQSPW